MRAILLIAAALGLSFIVISAVRKARQPKTPLTTEAPARAVFPKTMLDIGDKKQNSVAEGVYMIYNKGASDLLIEEVMPNCHCTVANYPKNKIAANDSAAITLRYDAAMLGIFQASAVVTTNASITPTILILRGTIVP